MADDQDIQLKLLMLGDSGVGKSCLVLRFANENKSKIESLPTIGIDFKIKRVTIGDKRLKLQIWDTAGQERYRTITTSYYRGSQGILLVYDITDKNSFSSIRNWVSQIKQHADANVVKILIGNKSDMQISRQVSYAEGEELAREFNMKFFETSAQQDVNVELAFMTIATDVYDNLGKIGVGQNVPGQKAGGKAGGAGKDKDSKGKKLKAEPAQKKKSWC